MLNDDVGWFAPQYFTISKESSADNYSRTSVFVYDINKRMGIALLTLESAIISLVLVHHLGLISDAWYRLSKVFIIKATKCIKSGTHWDREKIPTICTLTHTISYDICTRTASEPNLSAHLLIPSDQHILSVFVVFNGHSIEMCAYM